MALGALREGCAARLPCLWCAVTSDLRLAHVPHIQVPVAMHHTSAAPSKGRPVAFVLGAPGSGKGTQCERLVKEFGFLHLNAGGLLRQSIEQGGSEGAELAAIINDGRIVPAHVCLWSKCAVWRSADCPSFLITSNCILQTRCICAMVCTSAWTMSGFIGE